MLIVQYITKFLILFSCLLMFGCADVNLYTPGAQDLSLENIPTDLTSGNNDEGSDEVEEEIEEKVETIELVVEDKQEDEVVNACKVHIGSDIIAIAGQEVSLVARFDSIPMSLELNNPLTETFSKGTLKLDSTEGYKYAQLINFKIPAEAEAGNSYTLEVQRTDSNNQQCSDDLKLTIREQKEIGKKALYSWDLVMHAEWGNENDIPKISMVNNEETRRVYDRLFPDADPNDVPYPWIFQPQTSLVLGSQNLKVSCDRLLPGEGRYCIAVEDFITPQTDADGDFLFQIKPSDEKIIIYADTFTNVGAKDKTEIELKDIDSSIKKIKFKIYRGTAKGANTRYNRLISEETISVDEFSGTYLLWENQYPLFNSNDKHYSIKIVVEFQS